jgi:hypothetical protein
MVSKNTLTSTVGKAFPKLLQKRLDHFLLGRSTAAPQTPSRQQGPEPPFALWNYDADAALAGQYGLSWSSNLPSS